MNGEVPEAVVNDDGRLNPKSIANLMANLIASRQQNPNPLRHNITRPRATTGKIGPVKNTCGQLKKPNNKVHKNLPSVYPPAKLKSTQFLSAKVPKTSSSESDVSSTMSPPDCSTQTEFIPSPSEFIKREPETIFSTNSYNESDNSMDQPPPTFATVINYDRSPNVTIKQEEEEEEEVLEEEEQMEFKQENEPIGFSLEELEEEEVDVVCRRCDDTHFDSLSAFLTHLKFCRLQKQCHTVEMEPLSTNFDFETNNTNNLISEHEYLLINNHNGGNVEQDPLLQPVVLNVKSEVF